jgi:hypothetical protein
MPRPTSSNKALWHRSLVVRLGGHLAVAGQHIGEVLGMAVVPIDYAIDGKTQSMKVGDVGSVEFE